MSTILNNFFDLKDLFMLTKPAINYMFKVRNSTHCSSASIVNFEQVNAGWEVYFSKNSRQI